MDEYTAQTARTIVDQMGGTASFRAMLGSAPTVIKTPEGPGIEFRWPSRHPSKGNTCQVIYNEGSDTYTMKFRYVSRTKDKDIASLDDVYFDQLVPIFEERTGWYLRVPRIRMA